MSRQLFALCLLACLVAANAQGFCRTSSYAISLDKAVNNKKEMFKACGANVAIVSQSMKGQCAVIVQKVANKDAWDKYSGCEKSPKNSGFYSPLSKASSECSSHQKSGAC